LSTPHAATRRNRSACQPWVGVVLGLGVLVLLGLITAWAVSRPADPVEAGRVVATPEGFVADGRRLVLSGANVPDLAPTAAARPPRDVTRNGRTGRELVAGLFGRLARQRLNAVRVWAVNFPGARPLQPSPDTRDEEVMRGLDFVLFQAAKRGIRATLVLGDNWSSVDAYVDHCLGEAAADDIIVVDPENEARRHASFFDLPSDWCAELPLGCASAPPGLGAPLASSDPTPGSAGPGAGAGCPWRLWARHALAVLQRVSTVTGKSIADDPALMSVDLLNEPRCPSWAVPDCEARLAAWVEAAALVVRQAAPKTLVAAGVEGFWSPADSEPTGWAGGLRAESGAVAGAAGAASDDETAQEDTPAKDDVVVEAAEPGADWRRQTGQSVVVLGEHVDYITVHAWPGRWAPTADAGPNPDYAGPDGGPVGNPHATARRAFVTAWMAQHLVAAAGALGKPVVLEEYGVSAPRAWRENHAGKSPTATASADGAPPFSPGHLPPPCPSGWIETIRFVLVRSGLLPRSASAARLGPGKACSGAWQLGPWAATEARALVDAVGRRAAAALGTGPGDVDAWARAHGGSLLWRVTSGVIDSSAPGAFSWEIPDTRPPPPPPSGEAAASLSLSADDADDSAAWATLGSWSRRLWEMHLALPLGPGAECWRGSTALGGVRGCARDVDVNACRSGRAPAWPSHRLCCVDGGLGAHEGGCTPMSEAITV